MQRLAFVVFGLCVACTGPNPAYKLFSSDSAAPDAAAPADGAPIGGPADGSADRSYDRVSQTGLDSTAPADGPTPNGRLMGYWKFDEQPGATTAADSSGYGHQGILESLDSSDVWVTGRRGNAIQFPGTPDLTAGVRIPLTAALTDIRQFTVAAWIYRSALLPSQNTSILSRQLNTEFWEIYNLSTLNDELVIYAGTDVSPAPAVRVPGAAPVGVWMHVAATYDGATLRLYRDAQQVGSTPLTRALPAGTNPLYIGTNKNPTRNDPFIGLIDDVVLFSVALPASGITALYNGAAPASL